MKSYQRLLLFAIIVLAFTALLSPWAALTWDYTGETMGIDAALLRVA
ncbi:MAG: hypothetical protein HYU46_18365 [Deltaproteobacteria bacterium]|nr:hypothetical protein [Deltaproteobacteria bacterium]